MEGDFNYSMDVKGRCYFYTFLCKEVGENIAVIGVMFLFLSWQLTGHDD